MSSDIFNTYPLDFTQKVTLTTRTLCKNKDIIRLLFQSRTNVSVVSTFRFHAISVWKPKTIGRASRHQIPLPSVQRSTVSFFSMVRSVWFSIPQDSTFPLQNLLMESERPQWVNMTNQHTKNSERCDDVFCRFSTSLFFWLYFYLMWLILGFCFAQNYQSWPCHTDIQILTFARSAWRTSASRWFVINHNVKIHREQIQRARLFISQQVCVCRFNPNKIDEALTGQHVIVWKK